MDGYFPTRGMGEKPWPSGEDFGLTVDNPSRVQGAKDTKKGLNGLFT
jgi:hypothetical protein